MLTAGARADPGTDGADGNDDPRLARELPAPVTERDVAAPAPSQRLVERERPLAIDAIGEPIDPATFRLGPGDRLQLSIPDDARGPVALVVDAEGGVVLPGAAGRVALAGLTLVEARAAVAVALRREYRDQPFELSLTGVRRFKVFVGGEVMQPGSYLAGPQARVSEIIELAGGVRPGGSERRIVIEHSGGGRREADLVGFLLRGERAANPFLEGGDLIRVPPATEFFSIFGGVARPGRYELRPGETLGDALALAGGTVPGAMPAVAEWRRLEPGGLGKPRTVDLDAPETVVLPLAHGDALVVPLAGDARAYTVTASVVGEVARPGTFPLHPRNDTVADLLALAGGMTATANRDAVRVLRAVDAPGRETARRSLAESGIANRRWTEDEVLRVEERRWPRALALATAGDRESIDAAENVQVVEGDILYVPRLTGRVMVDGRVRRPGLVSWRADLDVDGYVELAGGFDDRADRGHVLIQRAGRIAEVEDADGAAPIGDGDLIWVPEKRQRGLWTITRETVSFLAQIATIAIIIDQAVSN